MKKNKVFFWGIWIFAFLAAMYLRIPSAEAEVQYGKAYDKTNYQEIEDLLGQGQLMMVKNGDIVFDVEKPEFEMKREPAYWAKSRENEGKFDVTEEGILVKKGTTEPVDWYLGYPFPTIDPKDPKASLKIMHNFESVRSSFGSKGPGYNKVSFVGDGGIERQVEAYLTTLYYVNRPMGQIPNPNGFLQQNMQVVNFPYDVRGVVSMSWMYLDDRQDSVFAYVPMLRRVRRTSPAARSDPFMGGDSGTDDAYGFYGKISSMTYKFLGERMVLTPWMDKKKYVMKRNPDGSSYRPYWDKKLAAEVPGARQAPFVWEGLIWIPLPVYLVEATPVDPYYNYGRQVFHISKDIFTMPYKDVYTKTGEYWKPNCLKRRNSTPLQRPRLPQPRDLPRRLSTSITKISVIFFTSS
jgi:hypothetical protein